MSAVSGHDSGNGGGSDQIGVGGQRVSGNDIANSTSGVPYHNVVGLQADRQVWSLNQFHTVFLIFTAYSVHFTVILEMTEEKI